MDDLGRGGASSPLPAGIFGLSTSNRATPTNFGQTPTKRRHLDVDSAVPLPGVFVILSNRTVWREDPNLVTGRSREIAPEEFLHNIAYVAVVVRRALLSFLRSRRLVEGIW